MSIEALVELVARFCANRSFQPFGMFGDGDHVVYAGELLDLLSEATGISKVTIGAWVADEQRKP